MATAIALFGIAQASPMFDYSDGSVGLNVWNGIFQVDDTFKLGTGLAYRLTDGDFTGGFIVISGAAQSSIAGLVPRLNSVEANVSSLQFFQTFNNDQIINFATSLTGAINMASGAFTAVTGVINTMTGLQSNLAIMTGQVSTMQSLMSTINFSMTGAIASLNSLIATVSSNQMWLAGVQSTLSGALVNKQDKFTGTVAQFVLGDGSYGTWAQSIVTRALNSGYILSPTKGTNVAYSVGITSIASLAGGQTGAIILEMSPTCGFTGSQEIGRMENGNSVSLAIALTATQIVSSQLNGFVPGGYCVRLRTAGNSNTYAWKSGQEMLIG